MPAKVSIKVEGYDRTLSGIRDLGVSLKNFPAEMRKSGEYLTTFLSGEVFDSEGATYGQRWVELSEGYRRWKEQTYPGKGILEATGRMRSSFDSEATSSTLTISNPVEYYQKHQEGIGVPKREISKMDEQRTNKVIELFEEGVQSRIDRALGKR